MIRYLDTRGLDDSRPTFTGAVMKGIANGGGLYVPERLPTLSLDEILALAEMPYRQRAAFVFERFEVDVAPERIAGLMQTAYADQWDDPRIAPVREIASDMHVLELWHGPTSAFKDMALQCMPLFFSEAISMRREAGEAVDDFLVLVATSGDTGKAALEGFADRPNTRIVVFYPAEGVSDIQRKQMVTQRGGNVGVFGVRGNFDDCQNAVKAAFADEAFNRELHEKHGLALSSANSINWGRLLPQIVYYLSAYADMVGSGAMRAGEPMDVCVPTGNFGNILGAYYARELGTPIGRLLCASNENKVLTDFIASGIYDISGREFVTTPSPSMDILISSNLERLLYELVGDTETVAEWMCGLREDGYFRVDIDTFAQVRELLSGDFVSNEDSLETIRRVWREHGYLLDPHTAVSWEVAERLRGDDPVLVVSTAHWAKFGASVYRALSEIPYAAPLPDEVRGLTDVQLLAEVQKLAPEGACVPRELAVLDDAEVRFPEVVGAGRESVEGAVRGWVGE